MDLRKKAEKYLENFYNSVYRAVQDEYATIAITNTTNMYYAQDLVFAERNPSHYDVIQGDIGDCFLNATLISLAKKSPKIIKDCIEYNKGDQFAYVKLYRLFRQKVKPVKILVDVIEIYKRNKGKMVPLWPEVIEDAYKQFIEKGLDLEHKRLCCGSDSKNLDEGGYEYCFMLAITGKVSKSLKTKKSKDISIIDMIQRKLNKRQSLTCSFKKAIKIKDVKSGEEIQIYNEHSYAIVGINNVRKYVRLIDPYKEGGRENSPKSKEGGHIAMSYTDFGKNFKTLDYATGKTRI